MATYTLTERNGVYPDKSICWFRGDDGSHVTIQLSPSGYESMTGYFEGNGAYMKREKVSALEQAVRKVEKEIHVGEVGKFTFDFAFAN
jgi:hypothetical protein